LSVAKHRALTALASALAVGTLALALVGVGPAGAETKGSGSGATFAELVGEPPTYFFPMFVASNWTVAYVPWSSYLMWPPLYLWGKNGKTQFNEPRSLAEAPTFSTNSAGDTVATITLKARDWSNGLPVTTRDIEFWMNLLQANKTTYAAYVPGGFPTDVKQITYLSSTKFQIVFDGKFSTLWLLGNILTNITPIPQQAWDRTSASGPVGNYDMTPGGATAVYKFLQSEAKSASTLATDPLWKVVDGPWQIKSFDATNGEVSFVPNPKFPWPQPHRLPAFTELPYTSTTAELDALESGSLDVGYVPLTSLKAIPHLEAEGYKIATWVQAAYGGLILNYAKNDRSTPIFDQLYFRQALTHLINMPQIIAKIYHGRASYASSPVPNPDGHGEYVTALGKKDPYPYDVAAAKKLLTEHGWRVVQNGTTTCTRPGTAPSECGSGVPKGAKLSFKIIGTQTSNTSYEILEYIISQFSSIGVSLKPKLVPQSNLVSDAAECSGTATSCGYDMELWITGQWPWGWPTNVPVGTENFYCGATSNYMALCNTQNDNLIKAVTVSPNAVPALEKWENFMAKEQFQIFLPVPAYRVVAYKKDLHGVEPFTPYLYIYPTDWYFTK
jgi:peptide/nickel transport system substrate-binding protein